ncbi:MAG: AAA family ATPase [Hungatella sp.]|jgi:SpoVK/Ycf46/Vps4 family AAA+-type ATPase|nr:AAA family ATPase [Hungatella sp.]MCI9636858.1 AAA family ATPase [Hungatella sp.]
MEKSGEHGIEHTKKLVANLLKARFPFIYISTWEEGRILDMIQDIAVDEEKIKTRRKVYIWSQTEGIQCDYQQIGSAENKNPKKALEYIDGCDEASIFIMKDFHIYLGVPGKAVDYEIVRQLRDLAVYMKNSTKPKNIVFISPVVLLPTELQKDITIVDLDLPNMEEIKALLEDMIDVNQSDGKIRIELDENEKERICQAAQGLTIQESENAFARAMVERGQLTINELDIIYDEKCQVIKKTGILELIKSDLKMEDVGGLENLKRWIEKRNRSWSDGAKQYGLPEPKGVLITGIPGCGKSLTAKAISAIWNLPLLRLDMGKIFSGIVGSSEENMRNAIKTAEAVAPSILWIDEIEKGMGGASGGGGDGGTAVRVFGSFLTWMQEKTKPVFVVATANNIQSLPPEMMRKGRFDEIFFVDLPTQRERNQIFRLHLKKRISNSKVAADLQMDDNLYWEIAAMTEGFSGAEIEQAVVAALFEAFSEERGLKKEDFFKAIRNTVPLSVTQSEQIIKLREWANVRAVAATATADRNEYEARTEDSMKIHAEKKSLDNVRKTRGGRTVDF